MAHPAADRLEINDDGMITPRPVLGWVHGPIGGVIAVLRLNYADSPQDQIAGGRHLQVTLTPQQALALAEDLTRTANLLLAQAPSGPPN